MEAEKRMLVNMDQEHGRQPRPGKEDQNTHRVIIKRSGKLGLASLRAYLDGQADFGTEVLQGISKSPLQSK